jgi:hypothetical protein
LPDDFLISVNAGWEKSVPDVKRHIKKMLVLNKRFFINKKLADYKRYNVNLKNLFKIRMLKKTYQQITVPASGIGYLPLKSSKRLVESTFPLKRAANNLTFKDFPLRPAPFPALQKEL